MIFNHTEALGGIVKCADDKTLKFYGAPLLHELNNTGKVNNDTKRH